MTAVDFARAIGVSQGAVCQWEIGGGSPRTDRVAEIARVLRCSVVELYSEATQ